MGSVSTVHTVIVVFKSLNRLQGIFNKTFAPRSQSSQRPLYECTERVKRNEGCLLLLIWFARLHLHLFLRSSSLSHSVFNFFRIITASRRASCVSPSSLSSRAVLVDVFSLFFFVFFYFLQPRYQFNSFPFYKVSADADWNTLRRLSKSNCMCPSFSTLMHKQNS